MVYLTQEEALLILKELNRLEGYLLGLQDVPKAILESESVYILTERLNSSESKEKDNDFIQDSKREQLKNIITTLLNERAGKAAAKKLGLTIGMFLTRLKNAVDAIIFEMKKIEKDIPPEVIESISDAGAISTTRILEHPEVWLKLANEYL